MAWVVTGIVLALSAGVFLYEWWRLRAVRRDLDLTNVELSEARRAAAALRVHTAEQARRLRACEEKLVAKDPAGALDDFFGGRVLSPGDAGSGDGGDEGVR